METITKFNHRLDVSNCHNLYLLFVRLRDDDTISVKNMTDQSLKIRGFPQHYRFDSKNDIFNAVSRFLYYQCGEPYVLSLSKSPSLKLSAELIGYHTGYLPERFNFWFAKAEKESITGKINSDIIAQLMAILDEMAKRLNIVKANYRQMSVVAQMFRDIVNINKLRAIYYSFQAKGMSTETATTIVNDLVKITRKPDLYKFILNVYETVRKELNYQKFMELEKQYDQFITDGKYGFLTQVDDPFNQTLISFLAGFGIYMDPASVLQFTGFYNNIFNLRISDKLLDKADYINHIFQFNLDLMLKLTREQPANVMIRLLTIRPLSFLPV